MSYPFGASTIADSFTKPWYKPFLISTLNPFKSFTSYFRVASFIFSCSLDIFTAEEETVSAIIGKEIHFGEVLGKHSDVHFEIEPRHIEVLSDDNEFIVKFIEILGKGTVSGINPLDYDEYVY